MFMQRNRSAIFKASTVCAVLQTLATHAAATTTAHAFSGNFGNDDELAWFDLLLQNGAVAARSVGFSRPL